MSSITPEDRRLIEEAIAAGKVTKCATGASGIYTYPIWDGISLVYDQKPGDFSWNANVVRKNAEKFRAKLDKIRQGTEDGLTAEQIAEKYGFSVASVRSARKRHKIKSQVTRGPSEDTLRKIEAVKAAYRKGMDINELSEALGWHRETVRGYVKRLNLEMAPLKHGGQMRPEVVSRRKRVAVMLDNGVSQAEIARRVGVSRAVLRHDLKAIREQAA